MSGSGEEEYRVWLLTDQSSWLLVPIPPAAREFAREHGLYGQDRATEDEEANRTVGLFQFMRPPGDER